MKLLNLQFFVLLFLLLMVYCVVHIKILRGGKMEKEYIFRRGFAQVCKEDVLSVHPDAVCFTVHLNGSVYSYNQYPYLESGEYGGKRWSATNDTLILKLCDVGFLCHDFENLYFEIEERDNIEITPEVWKGIEFCCGPEYTRITMDNSGAAYTHRKQDKIDVYETSKAYDSWMVVRVPGLRGYCNNWETSLREKENVKVSMRCAKGILQRWNNFVKWQDIL